MPPHDDQDVMLGKFLKAAYDQIGDKYRFGAHASDDDADPKVFDSSELVEWAAHRAGMQDMPDGSWNQYLYLRNHGATVKVDEALKTPGALVFGFSSDPAASSGRPARAYVAISVGDGKNVIDVSERAGEVRVMPAGDFYNYAAKIPDFHDMLPESIPIDTDGDGVPDASLRRPFPPGEIDTDGDGIPDTCVPVDERDVLKPAPPGRPVLVPDRRTNEPGPGDIIYEPEDDPVVPSAPSRGHGPSGQLIDQDLQGLPGGAEPVAVASYAGEPLPDDVTYYPAGDGAALADHAPSGMGPAAEATAYADASAYSAASATPTPAAETVAYADAAGLSAGGTSDAGYRGDTYSDSADSYTDLSADV